MNNYKYIGQDNPIHNAKPKVMGKGIYTNDMLFANLLHAKLLFSTVAHAYIKHIDTSQAEALPGVVKVFTHLNSPATLFNCYKTAIKQKVPQDEVLFTQEPKFVGDRIAAVVAVNAEIASQAAKLIGVEYAPLPFVLTPTEALKDASQGLLSQHVIEIGQKEMANATTHCLENTIETQKMHHGAIEPHVCIADFNELGKMTIWTPCQGAFAVRTVVAELLGLTYNNVRVIKMPTGGSFGGKQQAILEPVAAFLAKELKQPVKLAFNREESITSTSCRTATATTVKTRFTADGRLLERSYQTVIDAGAYATNSTDFIMEMGNKISKVYQIPYQHYTGKAALTNTPVSGGMRGWGTPEINTAIEIHMDQIARKLKLDPVELRLKNLVQPHDIDKVSRVSLGNARVRQCLTQGAKEFHWQEKYQNRQEDERFAYGVGVACGGHVNGYYNHIPDFSTMTLKMNEDGSFTLNTGLHDVGCGMVTLMQLILAEVLDTQPQAISVLEADTECGPYDIGTYSSRVTYVCGGGAKILAQKMKARILKEAAGLLKVNETTLSIDDATIQSAATQQTLTYKQLASTLQTNQGTDIFIQNTYHSTSNPASYGVHFAEVCVDKYTGLVRVTDFLAVQDLGKAINPLICRAQVQGAVQMGIGYALCEDLKIDAQGSTQNNNFNHYHVTNAYDMPQVKVLLIEDGGDEGPFGAKSIGEVSTVSASAAVVNAINHALGTCLTSLPVTPDKILAQI